MPQIEDLIRKFEEYQMACKTILLGVDRRLIEDLILHQQENPNIEYMYKIETAASNTILGRGSCEFR
jgi:hypothetical protein